MESDHSVTTCKPQPLHLPDLAGCGDYCSLGIYTTNCFPSFFVLGAISGTPLGDALQDVLAGRVIGGHEAQPNSWKWQVMLESYTWKKALN